MKQWYSLYVKLDDKQTEEEFILECVRHFIGKYQILPVKCGMMKPKYKYIIGKYKGEEIKIPIFDDHVFHLTLYKPPEN